MNKFKKIGLYDSGVGGLSILKELLASFPQHEYIYLADTLNLPYGDKDPEFLSQRLDAIHSFMKSKQVDLLIQACNTASTYCIDGASSSDLKIFNIIQPTIAETIEVSVKNKVDRIGILATAQTVKSNVYLSQLGQINPQLKVFQQPCPDLSYFIEEDLVHTDEFKKKLKEYLQMLIKNEIDILIPACTHYLFILEEIKKELASCVSIIDVRERVIEDLTSLLSLKDKTDSKTLQIAYTKKSVQFLKITKALLSEHDLSCYLVQI